MNGEKLYVGDIDLKIDGSCYAIYPGGNGQEIISIIEFQPSGTTGCIEIVQISTSHRILSVQLVAHPGFLIRSADLIAVFVLPTVHIGGFRSVRELVQYPINGIFVAIDRQIKEIDGAFS